MGFCFDDKSDHDSCDDEEGKCAECYIVSQDEVQYYGRRNRYVSFNKKAFSKFEAREDNIPCSTTHFFFLGRESRRHDAELVYDDDDIYYLEKSNYDDEVNFLYKYTSEKCNKKITSDEWCEKHEPGTWDEIYMLCADPLHRGPPSQ